MLLISSRRSSWEPNSFSNNEVVKNIDLTNPNDPGSDVSDAELQAAVAGKKLHLLIHGYNNDEAAIRDSYGIIDSMMSTQGLVGPTAPYDMVLGYVWPGGDLGLAYFFAKRRADKAGPRVQTLLLSVASIAASLDINTHSLGARVALQALRGVPGKPIRNLFMLAAAVDDESIEIGEKFYSSTQACIGAYVFHSKYDPVLKVWFPLSDFDMALGLNGPEDPSAIIDHSPNVKVVNCKKVIKSHTGYKSEPKIYQY
jgi:esterase/lipase superfamily enzyme